MLSIFKVSPLYEATVAENIAYGDWENLKSVGARIEQLSTIVGARDMIEGLPEKYDTLMGRMFGQYDFSGGLWQKISLARTLARKAPILILDEPTSNLDVEAEQELLNQFREIMKEHTTILISHRLSTTRLADRILVLDKGRLVEHGHHEELLSMNGFYARLYRSYQDTYNRQKLITSCDDQDLEMSNQSDRLFCSAAVLGHRCFCIIWPLAWPLAGTGILFLTLGLLALGMVSPQDTMRSRDRWTISSQSRFL